MKSSTLEYIQSGLEKEFIGYSVQRISNHITHIELQSKRHIGSTKFFGIFWKHHYELVEEKIEFDYSSRWTISYGYGYTIKKERYDTFCAVDETNEIVYWNYKRVWE